MPLLHWLTRDADIHAATRTPYRLLEEVPGQSHGDRDAGNMLIQGDNLDALKALLPYYAGKVKCIFIDPPYNTRSAFEHYDDNLEHTQWLALMYPRLELLRQLLVEDGSIWVTIDDNEAHYLKVIMDEVFGRKNFVANAIWQKAYSERMDATGFSSSHDHILCYQKTPLFQVKRISKEVSGAQFGFFDEGVQKHYRRRSLRKEGSESLRSDRPSMWYPIDAPDGTKVFPVKPNGVEGRWRWKKENVLLGTALLEFVRRDDRWEIYVKQYVEEDPTRPPATIWLHDDVGHNHEAKEEVKAFNRSDVFGTPKPERLMQRILTVATSPGDLVLDSFLGSGTTAAVAHKMGRRYIGIEMGDHAMTHCVPRLQRVIEGEQGGISEAVGWQGGGGFRFYRLGVPVFDESGHLSPSIRFAPLAAHLWFVSTGIPYKGRATSPFLGAHEGVGYFLLYNGILGDKRPEGGNVLTGKVLASLPLHEGAKVIFGEGCRLSAERLQADGITFRQIPYEIKAR
jgi:adenine-specific DNA-methyltransferase